MHCRSAQEKMDSGKLEELRRFGSTKMSEKWLPQCILFMKDASEGFLTDADTGITFLLIHIALHWYSYLHYIVHTCILNCIHYTFHSLFFLIFTLRQDIPKGSTGKPARIGLAKRMKLETLDIHDTSQAWETLSIFKQKFNAS